MRISKYKQEDGTYLDEEGCTYDDAESILISILGLCGCGMPDEVLLFVKDALELVQDLKENVWQDKKTYGEWAEDAGRVFRTCGIEYLTWNFLDQKGLLEHGGSLPGWLTSKGIDFLEDLREYAKNKAVNQGQDK